MMAEGGVTRNLGNRQWLGQAEHGSVIKDLAAIEK
jgi:hypothetical protein